MGRLDGKVAVVTGANSGIGLETAKLFCKEGAQVVLAARRAEALDKAVAEIREAGGDCIAVPCDVSKTEQVDALMEKAAEHYGKIDILVNSAGISDDMTPASRMDDDYWNNIIDVDLTGVMRCCRAVARYMEPANSGSIVNIASIGGVYSCAGASYSAAKAGVLSLTRNMAIQYYGTGIRVNSVSPGKTNTSMRSADALAKLDKEMLEATAPRKRSIQAPALEPIQQAYAILFFASDESSGINGENLTVDYGERL